MADGYRIFGAEMSPYSVKARSYFRYKAIPHQMDFCGMRQARPNTRNMPGCRLFPWWLRPRASAFKAPFWRPRVALRDCAAENLNLKGRR